MRVHIQYQVLSIITNSVIKCIRFSSGERCINLTVLVLVFGEKS